MRAIGRWSYGMYLWEIPVALLAVHWLSLHDLDLLVTKIAPILLTVAIAAVSFKFFESPIQHSDRLRNSPSLSLACAAGFMVLALVTISLVS